MPSQNDCRCEKKGCNCSAPETCRCGDRCACEEICSCGNGCKCASAR